MKNCPHCNGLIQDTAMKCKHCKAIINESVDSSIDFPDEGDITEEVDILWRNILILATIFMSIFGIYKWVNYDEWYNEHINYAIGYDTIELNLPWTTKMSSYIGLSYEVTSLNNDISERINWWRGNYWSDKPVRLEVSIIQNPSNLNQWDSSTLYTRLGESIILQDLDTSLRNRYKYDMYYNPNKISSQKGDHSYQYFRKQLISWYGFDELKKDAKELVEIGGSIDGKYKDVGNSLLSLIKDGNKSDPVDPILLIKLSIRSVRDIPDNEIDTITSRYDKNSDERYIGGPYMDYVEVQIIKLIVADMRKKNSQKTLNNANQNTDQNTSTGSKQVMQDVNLRETPSPQGKPIQPIIKEQYVTVLESKDTGFGKWHRVKYNEQEGWISDLGFITDLSKASTLNCNLKNGYIDDNMQCICKDGYIWDNSEVTCKYINK